MYYEKDTIKPVNGDGKWNCVDGLWYVSRLCTRIDPPIGHDLSRDPEKRP